MIRGDRRVLVLSAHSADFCSRAGGTILRFTLAGSEVQVYDMSYGERCESGGLWAKAEKPTIDEVKAVREKEIHAAAEILGASIACFDYGDSPLVLGPDRRLQILEALREFRPDLVLTHWLHDVMHPDHVEAAQAALWACSYSGAPGIQTEHPPCPRPELICFETTSGTAPVSGFVPDLYVDISDVFDRKMAALDTLEAQSNLPPMYVILGQYRGMEAQHSAGMQGCKYAEGFARIGRQAVGRP